MVTKSEFRFLLQYICEFYQYQIAFEHLDTGADGKIAYEEFIQAKTQMVKWGVDMRDSQAAWKSCDFTEDGRVDFMEFCDWAIKASMQLVSSDEEGAE